MNEEKKVLLMFDNEGKKVLMLNDWVYVLSISYQTVFCAAANVGGNLAKFNASFKWHKLIFERREFIGAN